ncbi:MAG: hypothetical protein LBK52_03035, partial [Deltaproteobacteria bacterium]|nr:hypothetical protein [Deltaproteobacteria bacterium]
MPAYSKILAALVTAGLLLFLIQPLMAAPEGRLTSDLETYAQTSDQLSLVTGMALTPALTLFISGLSRARLEGDRPWYASMPFLAVLGGLLLLMTAKDFVPAVQKPLAAAEENIMIACGILGLLASVPALRSLAEPILQPLTAFLFPLAASPAQAAQAVSGPASASLPASLVSGLVYAVIWCVSNSINVICLLAPALAAPILKGFRVLLTGGLIGLNAVHPLLGLAGALLIIAVSFICLRWSFRLTVWGWLFSYDLLLRRWRRKPGTSRWPAFAGSRARKQLRIPKRSYGYLEFQNETLAFHWRPFLFFKKVRIISSPARIGRCLLEPVLAQTNERGQLQILFTFRLAHKTHEDLLARSLGTPPAADMGVRKKAVQAWAWLRGLWKNRDLSGE